MKLPIHFLPARVACADFLKKKPCNGAPFLFYLVSAPLCFANVHMIFVFKTRLGQQTLDKLPQWFEGWSYGLFESSGNIPQLNMKREIQCSVEGQIAPSLRLRILCIAAKQRTSFDGRNSLSCKRGLVGQMFACALLHTAIRTVGRKSCAELRPLLTFWANKNDGHDDQWCQCSQIVQLAWGDKTMHLTTVVAHKKKQSHGAVFGSLEYDKLNKRWKRAPFQGLATHNIKRPT